MPHDLRTGPAGPLQGVITRVTAQLDPRVHSGPVDVWIQGQRFHLDATGTTSTCHDRACRGR